MLRYQLDSHAFRHNLTSPGVMTQLGKSALRGTTRLVTARMQRSPYDQGRQQVKVSRLLQAQAV